MHQVAASVQLVASEIGSRHEPSWTAPQSDLVAVVTLQYPGDETRTKASKVVGGIHEFYKTRSSQSPIAQLW